MIITRIYTGDDGLSHMEDFDLADHPNPESLLSVTSLVFRSHEPGRFSDWHRESRRNYIITLSGQGEIGLGDGTAHKIGPGQVMLVEDLTGQGHTTRVTSSVPRSLAGKPLAGFRATPSRRIPVLYGMVVYAIRFNNQLLHRQPTLRKRRLGENWGFRPSF